MEREKAYLGQLLGKVVFLGSGFMSLRLIPGRLSNLAGGIEPFNRSLGLVEDLSGLFNQRLDILDKVFLIELVMSSIGFGPFKMLLVNISCRECVKPL